MRKPKVDNPTDPVLWCKEAATRMEAGDNKGAIYCYQESLKIRPDVSDVWFNVGCLYERDGDKNAALGCFMTAEKMFTTDYRFPAERARMLAEMKHYSEAVEVISSAIEINPYSEVLLSNKAAYLIFAGDAAAALDAAAASLAIAPAYTAAILHKAHALFALKRGDEALAALGCGCDSEEKVDADKMGDVDGKDDSKRSNSVGVDMTDPRVLKMQANIALRVQKPELGLRAAQSLVELTPEDDEAWSLLGSAFAYTGDTAKAADAYARAVKLNPKEKSYKANLLAVKKARV